MKKLLKLAIYPLSGVVVFFLALVVMLAMKGKLNAESLQRVALVGAKTDTDAADEPQEIPTVATMRYFSSEELSAMLKEARELKAKCEADRARLVKREERLKIFRQDLAKAKEELLAMRAELDRRRAELRKAEQALEKRVTLVKQTEAAGLRRSAMIHEAMDPKKAAAALAALDEQQAAKTLAFIQEKKAARILEEMKPEAASHLLALIQKVKSELEDTND